VLPSASIPPAAPKAPAAGAIAPAPLTSESKKETAKVPPSSLGPKPGMPQATVQLQKKPAASSSKSVSTSASITVAPQPEPASVSGDVSPAIGAAALVVALIALGLQLWIFIS